jgi:hypothetical protein
MSILRTTALPHEATPKHGVVLEGLPVRRILDKASISISITYTDFIPG